MGKRDEIQITRVKYDPEKIKLAIERAARNSKLRVAWHDKALSNG